MKKQSTSPTPPPATAPSISADDLSAIVGVTSVRLKQLADAGSIPPPVAGRYELRPTLIALFRFYRAHRGADETGSSYGKARLRKLEAEAELAELQAGQKRGALIPTEEVQRVISSALIPARQQFVSLAAEMAARANPGDPELARLALAEWSERAMRTVQASIK